MISEEKNEAMSGSDSSSSEDMGHVTSSAAVHSVISAAMTVSAGGQSFAGSNGLNMSSGSANPLQSFIQGAAVHGQQGAGRQAAAAAAVAAGHNIMHYAQDGNNPFFLPSSLNSNSSSNSPSNMGGGLPGGPGGMGGMGMGGPHGGGGPGGHHMHDVGSAIIPGEPNKKREIRLMKNREAARECRRKKKEYIKCLENRVAVLENQNKQLIEELKSLKELYTGKQVRKTEIQ